MLRFTVKSLLLLSTLLFGILFGIQQAEEGILSLQGLEQGDSPSFFITKIDDEQIEKKVLNNSFSVEELEEKQAMWEERKRIHRWSELGHRIGDAVYSLSRKGAEWFVKKIDQIL